MRPRVECRVVNANNGTDMQANIKPLALTFIISGKYLSFYLFIKSTYK